MLGSAGRAGLGHDRSRKAGAPEVTEKMISAGLRALEIGRGASDDFSLVREIYAAMREVYLRD